MTTGLLPWPRGHRMPRAAVIPVAGHALRCPLDGVVGIATHRMPPGDLPVARCRGANRGAKYRRWMQFLPRGATTCLTEPLVKAIVVTL